METALALLVGLLYASGFYLMLRRSAVKLIFGSALLGHAANLLLFAMGGIRRQSPPILPTDEPALASLFVNPLPQALVLTAIVIGFGLQAFALTLVYRIVKTVGSDDVDELVATDREAAAGGLPSPGTASRD